MKRGLRFTPHLAYSGRSGRWRCDFREVPEISHVYARTSLTEGQISASSWIRGQMSTSSRRTVGDGPKVESGAPRGVVATG